MRKGGLGPDEQQQNTGRWVPPEISVLEIFTKDCVPLVPPEKGKETKINFFFFLNVLIPFFGAKQSQDISCNFYNLKQNRRQIFNTIMGQ